ncbi:thrombomodulin-like [Rana temporaria]|uniref:thrombomodulin-like n=1 Tax=Rana temporaria TaxID=8407 RepID=UPI001AADA37A|nr:thrombomodulin-like [Rana temporaria]
MLLLYGVWVLVTWSELALLASSLAERQREFLCVDQACYSVSWSSRRYARAREECEGNQQDLMTVKSSEQEEVVSRFLSKVTENIKVWIGMKPKKGCTDVNLPLRGFTWVTGESDANSILWKDDEQKCPKSDDLCVTMNNRGTWEETDCTFKSDGLLCESSHSVSCEPLVIPDDYNVIYFHKKYGMGLSFSHFYPSDTMAKISSYQDNLICKDNGDGQSKWTKETPGAWPCEIEDGGCEFECTVVNGTPECKCPPGSTLKQDKKSCSSRCDPNLCSQDCDPNSKPPSSPCSCYEGYLAEDGKTCLDDDCATHPNLCGYLCTKSKGSFTCGCKSGYKNVTSGCEIPGECGVKCQDVDECETTICEHACENFPGGFKCVCDEGFVLSKINPRKCKRVCNTSDCEAECNTKSCYCPDGYILGENKECMDIDECLDSPCEGSCTNLFGSFKCTCPEGYTVHSAECVPDGTEGPGGVATEATSPESFPQVTFSIEPAILLGICIGVVSMLTVLIVMVCYMLRKHYMDQHDLDYKVNNNEKYVVLQQVKTIPQWRF